MVVYREVSIMKTLTDIMQEIEKACLQQAIRVFCRHLPVDCLECGIPDYMCPKYIYSICADTIESW